MWSEDDMANSNLRRYLPALSADGLAHPVKSYVEKVALALGKENEKTHKPPKVNMMPMTQNTEAISGCEWVPDECVSGSARVLPEQIGEFGKPWLLGYNQLCTRAAYEKTPFVGMPAYVFTFDQPILLMAWNLKEVQKLNAKLDTTSFIEKIGKDKNVEWCKQHFKITMMRAKACVWIPFGWRYVTTGMGPKHTIILHQPVLSTPYVRSHPNEWVDCIAKFQLQFCQDNAAKGPFVRMISPYKTWLKTLTTKSPVETKVEKKEKKEKTDKKDKKDKKSSSSKSVKSSTTKASKHAKGK